MQKSEGAIAYTKGVKVGDNPYDPQKEETQHWDWMQGWVSAAKLSKATQEIVMVKSMNAVVNIMSGTNIAKENIVIDNVAGDKPTNRQILDRVGELFCVKMNITPFQEKCEIKFVNRDSSFTLDHHFYPADKMVIEILIL